MSYAVSARSSPRSGSRSRTPARRGAPRLAGAQGGHELGPLRHRMLRPYAVSLHLTFFANAIVTTVLVYFAATELDLDAPAIGLILAASRPASSVPVWRPDSPRHGLGSVVTAAAARPSGIRAAPARGPGSPGAGVACGRPPGTRSGLRHQGTLDMSYRNTITPDRLRGRMNATIRSLNWGSIAVSAPSGVGRGDVGQPRGHRGRHRRARRGRDAAHPLARRAEFPTDAPERQRGPRHKSSILSGGARSEDEKAPTSVGGVLRGSVVSHIWRHRGRRLVHDVDRRCDPRRGRARQQDRAPPRLV